MADRFPVELIGPGNHRWYIAGAGLTGGQPVVGSPQTADMATGGSWVHEFSVALLFGAEPFAVWESVVAELNSGVAVIEWPRIDILRPFPGGVVPPLVPHSDGAPFGDGSLYVTRTINAELAADAYMPAWPAPVVSPNMAQIRVTAGSALKGGESFSIIGPSGQVRMHKISRILGQAGNVYTVKLRPPLREDMAAGTPVDFNDPRCLMKADLASIADAWPDVQANYWARPKIKLVEAGV